MPQSTTLGLNPVIHVPNYMDHYSLQYIFPDPLDFDPYYDIQAHWIEDYF